jgi:hypothetical protein
VVEHNLAKVGVEGSNPFARSKFRFVAPEHGSICVIWRGAAMRRRRSNEVLPKFLDAHREKTRGGSERVARRFLPHSPAATLIRLDAGNPRRALSRRRLARLIDTRRVVS